MGASCRHAHASGPHAHHTSSTVAGGTGKYCLLISHLSSHRIIISLVTNLPFTIPFTSPTSPVRAVLVGLVALSSTAVTPEAKMVLSAPRPPSHILISSLCSGPVCGRAWVSRLLPTSGHVAHGSVSSIDETRQPRVSSIARSRLGLPSQTRVTVTHTSVPSPISMRGAAPEVFASGTERELTGSG